jgi:hypothetical protein
LVYSSNTHLVRNEPPQVVTVIAAYQAASRFSESRLLLSSAALITKWTG